VAVIARMNDYGIIGQAGTLKTGEDRTDALINESDEAEVFLFQVSIIVQSETELELTNGSAFIVCCSIVLPFTGKAVSQREVVVRRRTQRSRIQIHVVNRMLTIKRAVVRGMRFDERHHQNERLFPIPLNDFARVLLDKSGLR